MSPIDAELHDKEIVTRVLLTNVVGLLQRMESWMEGQDKRLSMIENSTRDARQEVTVINKPLPIPPEEHLRENEDYGDLYGRPVIQSTRYKFEDSLSDFGDAVKGSGFDNILDGNRQPGCYTANLRADFDNDANSLSVYSRDGSELRAPAPDSSRIEVCQTANIITIAYETTTPGADDLTQAGDTTSQPSRSSSERSRKTSPSTRSWRPHQAAEMAFYAFDNWKRGVLSRIKNEERSSQTSEAKTLSNLGPQAKTLLSAVGKWLKSKASIFRASQNVFVY